MTVKTIAVIGAGTMGNGITQVCAMAGFPVIMHDIAEEAVQGGLQQITHSLGRLVNKQQLTEQQQNQALALITPSTELNHLAQCDVIIEAATEKLEIKLEIFQALDQCCAAHTILASNTSSISLTKIASVTKRPQQVIGMHFMNPVPIMELVELINALQTDQQTYDTIEQLTRDIGKVPVKANDSPGFVANRILMPMINEAIFTLHEGIADKAAIDDVMKLGMNHPIGPLALADLIGLDVCLSVLQILQKGFGDPKFRPCPLLIQMVDAGYLGRKSGKGFYQY